MLITLRLDLFNIQLKQSDQSILKQKTRSIKKISTFSSSLTHIIHQLLYSIFIIKYKQMLTKHWVQKLNQFKKLQKTLSLNYIILKTLWESLQQEPSIAKTEIFQSLLKSLPKEIHSLGLYSQLIHKIWRDEDYAIGVREGCCPKILFVVTEWIMYFELESEKADNMGKKFRLLKEFIQKHSKSIQTTILVIEQVFEDLKDLFERQFWSIQQKQSLQNNKGMNKYLRISHTNEQNSNSYDDNDCHTAQQLISLLQLITFRELEIIFHKQTSNNKHQEQVVDFSCYLSTARYPATNNYYEFVFKCVNYLLGLKLQQSQQSQATRLAFEIMRSMYGLRNKKLLVNMFRRLMTCTQKAVRFALVQQYMEMYKIFNNLEFYDIIQELQEMNYFRELIVGHAKITQKESVAGSEEQVSESYESSVLVKAGGKEKVYFSLEEAEKGIVKLDLALQQGMDINLRFYHFTTGNKQILYHQVQKTDLSKLHLKLDFTGLYALQFDNSYSWISTKHIQYHVHLLNYISNSQIMQQNN